MQYKVAINKVTVALQDLPSVNGIGRDPSQPGFDWQNAFSSLVSAAPAIITASRPGSQDRFQQFDQGLPSMRQDQQVQRPGISTNTILLIGGAALAAFLIFKKK